MLAGWCPYCEIGKSLPARQTGRVNRQSLVFRFLGGSFGIAILVVVFDQTGHLASPQGFSEGFSFAVDAAAAPLVALGLPGRQPRAALATETN